MSDVSELTERAATRCRILVADDNPDAASALGMLLELMGNEVRLAHDGMEAVKVAATFLPDIIILDIDMPRLNGYDTCSRIRTQPSNTSVVIVALTGWTQQEMKQRSQQAGFDFHLIKPVELATLQELLTHHPLNAPA